jgi:probable rRNA maturation factor
MIVVANKSGHRYSEKAIKKAARAIFYILNVPDGYLLEINLVDVRTMSRLNKKFRGKSRATTVLSFAGGGFLAGRQRILGEIYLCPRLIFEQIPPVYVAAGDKQAYLMYYLAHGILHLRGFDHESSSCGRRRMERFEKRIFQSISRRVG